MHNIKDVVHDVLSAVILRKPELQGRIERVWGETLSDKEKKHTKLANINKGRLIVHVDSSAWLYQMNTRKKTILESLQSKAAEVKDVSFKVGKIK